MPVVPSDTCFDMLCLQRIAAASRGLPGLRGWSRRFRSSRRILGPVCPVPADRRPENDERPARPCAARVRASCALSSLRHRLDGIRTRTGVAAGRRL